MKRRGGSCGALMAILLLAVMGCYPGPQPRQSIADDIAAVAAPPTDSSLALRTFLLSEHPTTERPVWVLYLLVNGNRMRQVDTDPDLFRFDLYHEGGEAIVPFTTRGSVARSSGTLGMVTLDAGGMAGGVVDLTCMSLRYGLRTGDCHYGFRLTPGDYKLITLYQRGPLEDSARPGFERVSLADTIVFAVGR